MKNFKKSSVVSLQFFICSLLSVVCWLLFFPAYAGEYDSEIFRHQQMIAKNPTDIDAAYQLGNFLAWDKRYDEALVVFQDILNKEPKYEDAAIGIAHVYAWKGEPEKAAKKYEEILVRNPKNFEGYQGLGSLLLWANDFEKSIDYFKKALDINPNDTLSLKGIGRAYLGKGDRRRAEEYFTKAQILEVKQISLSFMLAIAVGSVLLIFSVVFFVRTGNRRRKKEIIQLELKVLRYALALYHQKTGKFPLALENLFGEKWRPPGKTEDRTYLEGMRRGDRGFLMDPFGKRYWYNPDTGGVHSTTKGYEEW